MLAAVNAAGADGDLFRLLARTDAVAALLGTEDGTNLLAAGRRAANILRIEDKKEGPQAGPPDASLYEQEEERDLAAALSSARLQVTDAIAGERFEAAMAAMAALRAPLDRFFDRVTVNADDRALRRNRLSLLAEIRDTMGQIADFSLVEG